MHPERIGPLLARCYTEQSKIAQLLALGSLPTRSGVSYERDRGDDPQPAEHIETLGDLIEHPWGWMVFPIRLTSDSKCQGNQSSPLKEV
jgi:hypothetical protein